jgi:hypothetical protein
MLLGLSIGLAAIAVLKAMARLMATLEIRPMGLPPLQYFNALGGVAAYCLNDLCRFVCIGYNQEYCNQQAHASDNFCDIH